MGSVPSPIPPPARGSAPCNPRKFALNPDAVRGTVRRVLIAAVGGGGFFFTYIIIMLATLCAVRA